MGNFHHHKYRRTHLLLPTLLRPPDAHSLLAATHVDVRILFGTNDPYTVLRFSAASRAFILREYPIRRCVGREAEAISGTLPFCPASRNARSNVFGFAATARSRDNDIDSETYCQAILPSHWCSRYIQLLSRRDMLGTTSAEGMVWALLRHGIRIGRRILRRILTHQIKVEATQ